MLKGPTEGRKKLDLLKGAAKLKMGGARAFAAAADLTKKHKEADPEGFAAKEVAADPNPGPKPKPKPEP